MGDIVNLRAARRRDERRAAENRRIHGRSKAGRRIDAVRRDKAAHDLVPPI